MTLQTLTHIVAISGGVLYVMAAVLLIGLVVIVDRSWALTRVISRGEAVRRTLAGFGQVDRATLEQLASTAGNGPHRALLEAPLQYPHVREPQRLAELLEETIMVQAPQIDRRLWVLDTVVTLGPLLGLFGTIIGMFNAFQVLGSPGIAPAEITGGVAEALVATAAGLLIAIIGLVFFNGLQNRARLVAHQLETLKVMLVNRLIRTGNEGVKEV